MEYIKSTQNAGIVLAIIEAIHENAGYLSEIDGAIGDGDHGVNMNKGFMMAKERIDSTMSLSQGFDILGKILVMDIGGSIGPIYGTLFSQFSKGMKEEKIYPETILTALENGVEKLMDLAGARIGDKTLIDTIYHAKRAYETALKEQQNFQQALENLCDGAEYGKESTKNLIAKVGRAARLGERSKGFLDAGATSCSIILKTMAHSMQKLVLENE